jgi:hypothetical protein
MDLEKLEQQAKALEGIDPSKMDEKQLTQLAEQLSSIFEESESFINSLTEELKKEENESND